MKTAIRILLPVWALCFFAGCVGFLYPSPTKECLQLRELFAKDVRVGMTETNYLAFCRSRGWELPTYDKYQNRYVKRIPVSKGDNGKRHSITIEVSLTEDHKVKSHNIYDSYTGL